MIAAIKSSDTDRPPMDFSLVETTVAPLKRTPSELFAGSHYSALRGVSSTFDSTTLTLRGELPSYFLKQMAQEFALRNSKARKLVNRIEVRVRPR